MEKEKLNEIKALTNGNNHTHARSFIANNFTYLKHFAKLFKAMNRIQELEGNMPYNVLLYSNELTKDMFKIIKSHEGKEKAEQIHACL